MSERIWVCHRCGGTKLILMARLGGWTGAPLHVIRCPCCTGTVSLKRKIDMKPPVGIRSKGRIYTGKS